MSFVPQIEAEGGYRRRLSWLNSWGVSVASMPLQAVDNPCALSLIQSNLVIWLVIGGTWAIVVVATAHRALRGNIRIDVGVLLGTRALTRLLTENRLPYLQKHPLCFADLSGENKTRHDRHLHCGKRWCSWVWCRKVSGLRENRWKQSSQVRSSGRFRSLG